MYGEIRRTIALANSDGICYFCHDVLHASFIRPHKGKRASPFGEALFLFKDFRCDFAVRLSAILFDRVRRQVHFKCHLYAGSAPHVALDEARHFVGWKLKGPNVCHGPPRGHRGNLCADRSVLLVHAVRRGLQSAHARGGTPPARFPFVILEFFRGMRKHIPPTPFASRGRTSYPHPAHSRRR